MSTTNFADVVTAIIADPSPDTISRTNFNPTTSTSTSPLQAVSSGELEVNDVVAISSFSGSYRLGRISQLNGDEIKVLYFDGPQYNINVKKPEENIKCEEIILALERIPSIKAKWYSVTDTDLDLIVKAVFKRHLLKEKLANHDSLAEEFMNVKQELLVFGRTRTERALFVCEMENILLGTYINKKESFKTALKYASSNTLNITYDIIIKSIISQAENTVQLDPNAAVLYELAGYIAETCFCSQSIAVIDEIIMGNTNENMKHFLKECLNQLVKFVGNQPKVQNEFLLQSLHLMNKVIMKEIL